MNENAKRLHLNIEAALKDSELARVDVAEYAEVLGVSLRSAQRYLKEIEQRKKRSYEIRRRAHDGARYFVRPGAAPLGVLLEDVRWNKYDNGGFSVVSVASDNLSVYKHSNGDLGYGQKPKTIDHNNGVSQATSQTTPTTSEAGIEAVNIWYADTDGAFRELANAVCTVCQMNPLLLLEEDEAKIAKLFAARVDPDELIRRYGRGKANFWYCGYWKGKRNAWPTLNDVLQTWEMSKEYQFKPEHQWPPVADIVEFFITTLQKHGRRNGKAATAELEEAGYGRILERLPSYYDLTVMPVNGLRSRIQNIVREILSAEYRSSFVD